MTAIEAAKSLLFWKLPPAEGEEQNQTDQEVHGIPARCPAEANGRAGRLAVPWAGGEEGGGRAEGLRVEATEQRPGRGERVGRADGCWSLFHCSYCTFQLQNLYLYIL